MDIAKYVSMLKEKSLHFSQAHLLEDSFEGSLAFENKRLYLERYNSNPSGVASIKEMSSINLKKYIYLNCWHLNKYESVAMWSLYGGQKGAIAIRSTYSKLFNVLPKDISLGMVDYIDYNTELIPEEYIDSRFFCKRKSFSHEKEIRAVLINIPNLDNPNSIRSVLDAPGININIDLKELIDSVYVSPKAPNWYKSLLNDLHYKYEFDFEIFQSALDDNIIF